ncbi:hypothetical protein DMH04_41200 [Kibdelosporangium aridum]|uniref:Uncharacterized protein n=1 Tax=Kibdelosporangium aridum TaxID=2030 RepID=A0A428YUX1_KIBAR|nr:hypothetical protein [Kibdelosporangium aridum]RSM73431.1 hypothetical protein DMH04_41200 [Kibdelosporangium aridum]
MTPPAKPLKRTVPCWDALGNAREIDVQLHGRVILLKPPPGAPVELSDDAAILLASTVLTMILKARDTTAK